MTREAPGIFNIRVKTDTTSCLLSLDSVSLPTFKILSAFGWLFPCLGWYRLKKLQKYRRPFSRQSSTVVYFLSCGTAGFKVVHFLAINGSSMPFLQNNGLPLRY